MNLVIGRYYKEYKDAEKYRLEMEKLNLRRRRFIVVSYPKGNVVISESAARKCWPNLFPVKEKPWITRGKAGRPKHA